jgi:hypothetical protein
LYIFQLPAKTGRRIGFESPSGAKAPRKSACEMSGLTP